LQVSSVQFSSCAVTKPLTDSELSMGWVDPWVGLGWVTRNGHMDNSELTCNEEAW